MRKLASATVVVVAILIVALALWQMREAVQLLLVALAVSAALSPAVSRLSERGMGRAAAAGAVVLITLVLFGLAIAGIGSQVLIELEQAAAELPPWYDQARQALLVQGGWAASYAGDLPPSFGLISRLADAEALPAVLMGMATRLSVGALLVLSAASLGFYWLLDQARIERVWLSLLPLQARSRVRSVWIRVYKEVGLYVRGGAAVSLLTVASLLATYMLLGLPGAALLALFGGLAVIVPVLGPPLVLVPPLLVALGRGTGTDLVAVGAAATVIVVIKLLVAPRLFRQGVNVNPVLTIICIMALAEVAGLWLTLLGPTLAAAIQTTAQALREEQAATANLRQAGPEALTVLHARLDAIEASAAPDEPQVGSLVGRARGLVSAAGDLLARTMHS
jgi:predicted PurR-regulated permease PerM